MAISNWQGPRPAINLVDAIWVTLFAAIAAGSIDLVYAASFGREGATMTDVMRAIASGVLGAAAFKGGASAALLGMLCHYGILWIAGCVFVLSGRFWPIVFQRPLVSGTAFGIGVFVAMKVIVKASRAPFDVSTDLDQIIRNLLVHILAVGIPMALIIVMGVGRTPIAKAAD